MPIDKAEIRTLIPHAGLMCLLDSVLGWDDESIICTSQTHRDPDNPLRRNGQLSALHAFEYGAQAAGVHGGLKARSVGMAAPPFYLVALRDAHLQVTRLDDIDLPLEVRAQRVFGDASNAIYECRVLAADALLADARITFMLRT
jgi:predicted hotdog family 3-hydroxylacyl-ACP dehydratase